MSALQWSSGLLAAVSILGCNGGDSSSPPADPAGTHETTLREMYGPSNGGPDKIDFDAFFIDGVWENVCSQGSDIALHTNVFLACDSIADIGAVSGLAEIVEGGVPVGGFGTSAAALEGEGYVVKSDLGAYFGMYDDDQISEGQAIRWIAMTASSSS